MKKYIETDRGEIYEVISIEYANDKDFDRFWTDSSNFYWRLSIRQEWEEE